MEATQGPTMRLFSLLFAVLVIGSPIEASARTLDLIVIHATGGPGCRDGKLWHAKGGSLESNLRYFRAHPKIGFHYMIGRDGKTVAGVPESQVANHAYGHNRTSIGIELVNDGNGQDPFPEVQLQALIKVLKRLTSTYGLTPAQIKSHSQVDNRAFKCGGKSYKRKIDPGGEFPGSAGNFPWDRIRDAVSRRPTNQSADSATSSSGRSKGSR